MPKVIKIVISGLMLWLVLRLVESRDLLEALREISLGTVLIVVVGYFLGQALSAYKWLLIARSAKIDTSFIETLKAYYIGAFVNSFGLGVVGGDVARGLLLTKKEGAKTPALASVIADRAHGLAVLALIGMIAAVLTQGATLEPRVKLLLIICVPAIIAGWWLGPILLKMLFPKTSKLRIKAEQVEEAFPKDFVTLVMITIISVIFHSTQIALHWVIAQALGVNLAWSTLFVYVPVVNILATLPLSWNGLGVRETSYLYFLAPAITASQSVAFGAIWLLALSVTSAIGGLISVITKK